MTETGRSFDSLHAVIQVVMDADVLDEALYGLMIQLQPDYELWNGTLGVLSDEAFSIVAVWAAVTTLLQPGTTISLDLTPTTRAMATELRKGRPVPFDPAVADLGMISDILRDEGVRSSIAIPLHDGHEVVGVLALNSSQADAFSERDIPFFTGVGRGLEQRLLRLAGRIKL